MNPKNLKDVCNKRLFLVASEWDQLSFLYSFVLFTCGYYLFCILFLVTCWCLPLRIVLFAIRLRPRFMRSFSFFSGLFLAYSNILICVVAAYIKLILLSKAVMTFVEVICVFLDFRLSFFRIFFSLSLTVLFLWPCVSSTSQTDTFMWLSSPHGCTSTFWVLFTDVHVYCHHQLTCV